MMRNKFLLLSPQTLLQQPERIDSTLPQTFRVTFDTGPANLWVTPPTPARQLSFHAGGETQGLWPPPSPCLPCLGGPDPHPAEALLLLFGVFWFVCLFILVFLGLHPQHMEVPRLGVKSELQLLVYATARATATQDLSHVYNLHCSWHQYWIL